MTVTAYIQFGGAGGPMQTVEADGFRHQGTEANQHAYTATAMQIKYLGKWRRVHVKNREQFFIVYGGDDVRVDIHSVSDFARTGIMYPRIRIARYDETERQWQLSTCTEQHKRCKDALESYVTAYDIYGTHKHRAYFD